MYDWKQSNWLSVSIIYSKLVFPVGMAAVLTIAPLGSCHFQTGITQLNLFIVCKEKNEKYIDET